MLKHGQILQINEEYICKEIDLSLETETSSVIADKQQ